MLIRKSFLCAMHSTETPIIEFLLAHVVPAELVARWRAILFAKKAHWKKLDPYALARKIAAVREVYGDPVAVAKSVFGSPQAPVMRIDFGHGAPRAQQTDAMTALS